MLCDNCVYFFVNKVEVREDVRKFQQRALSHANVSVREEIMWYKLSVRVSQK